MGGFLIHPELGTRPDENVVGEGERREPGGGGLTLPGWDVGHCESNDNGLSMGKLNNFDFDSRSSVVCGWAV